MAAWYASLYTVFRVRELGYVYESCPDLKTGPAPVSESFGRFRSGIRVCPRSSLTSPDWLSLRPEADGVSCMLDLDLLDLLDLLDSRLGSREMDGDSGAGLSTPSPSSSSFLVSGLLLRTGEATLTGAWPASGLGEGGSNRPSMVLWRHLLRSGPGHSGSVREESTGRETETLMPAATTLLFTDSSTVLPSTPACLAARLSAGAISHSCLRAAAVILGRISATRHKRSLLCSTLSVHDNALPSCASLSC
jgi:hypothetical protein